MKPQSFRPLYVVISLALLVTVSACGAANSEMSVGVLTAETPGEASQAAVLTVAAEQNMGYQLAETQEKITLSTNYLLENDPQQEIAVAVRGLIENENKPVIALVGATSNDNSMRLGSLSNFFNLPGIIPSAVGDNVLPANNLWSFALSAPGSAHAEYLFGSVVTRLAVQSFNPPDALAVPQLKVAILYEQNTFGESAAVAAAKAAMAQELEIGFYGYFDPTILDSTRLKEQAGQIKAEGVHLVYLISNQPEVAREVLNVFAEVIPPAEMPILVGQSGAFSSLELLESPEAQGLFVLRQKIVPDQCPAEISSLTEAQSYAALVLLESAVVRAREQAGNTYATQTLLKKREDVRDILKAYNDSLPCLGKVSFANTGQNKNLQFELLQVTSGGLSVISTESLLSLLKPIYQRNPLDYSPSAP